MRGRGQGPDGRARGRGRRGATWKARTTTRASGGDAAGVASGGEDSIGAIRRAPSARAGRVRAPGRGREARGRASSARARGDARGDVRVRHPRVFPRVSGSIGATARGRARRARRGVADPEDEGGCRREIQIWLVRDCGRQQQHSRPRSSRASHEPTRVKSTRAPSRARSGRTRSARARTPGGFERAPLQSSASSPPSGRARAGRAPGVVARGRPEATRRSLPRRAFLGNARSRDDVRGSPPPPVDPRHAARLRSSPDGYVRASRAWRSSRAPEDEDEDEDDDEDDVGRRGPPRTTPGAVPATGPAPGHRFGRPRLEQPPLAPGDHRLARQPFFVSFPFAPVDDPSALARSLSPPRRLHSRPIPPPKRPPSHPSPPSEISPDVVAAIRAASRARPRRPALPPRRVTGGEAAAEALARAAAPFQPFRSNARHPGAIIVADPVPLRPGIRGRVPAGGTRSERAPRPAAGPSSGASVYFASPPSEKAPPLFGGGASSRRSADRPNPSASSEVSFSPSHSPLFNASDDSSSAAPLSSSSRGELRAPSLIHTLGDAVVNALARKKLEEARRTHSQRRVGAAEGPRRAETPQGEPRGG